MNPYHRNLAIPTRFSPALGLTYSSAEAALVTIDTVHGSD